MTRWMLYVVALAGCGRIGFDGLSSAPAPALDATSDAADATATIDAPPVDSSVGAVCVGTFVRVCVDPPSATLTLTTQRIDTSTSPMCGRYTSTPAINACVIAAAQIELADLVTVVGSRPIILLSTGGLTISGTLDAGSHVDFTGPAADAGPCATDFANPVAGGSGGGWGGSFGRPGNNGGNSPSGVGGSAPTAVTVSALTGGCAGGRGANNASGLGAGAGGHSGGAVALLAAQVLTIDGVVNASGRGGSSGSGGTGTGGGGGGGGSGGMILLDAATVRVTGECFANGGGGGEGGNVVSGNNGSESTAPNTVGAGGAGGNATGGDGGASAFGDTSATTGVPGVSGATPSPGNGGGGGGGGGGGVIKVFALDQQGTDDIRLVAPPPR